MALYAPATFPEAYATHKHYLDALNRLTRHVQLNYTDSVSEKAVPAASTKRKLIELTQKSIDAEVAIRKVDVEYAAAALPWIPAKVYYLIFYHSLTLEYLICCDQSAFGRSHTALIDCFTTYLNTGRLVFSEPILNQTFTIEELLASKQTAATQLRHSTSDSTLFTMLMKNVAKHCLDDEKRKKKWKTRTTIGKAAMQAYCKKRISIFHHPFVMRHRTNYKNVDFVEGVPNSELANYFDHYITYGNNLTRSIDFLTASLINKRSGSNIQRT